MPGATPKEPVPRAVVIPFGVPEDGRGLGLGLAALMHSFTLIEGQSVALAQLLTRKPDQEQPGAPVEAFVPPQAWKDLAGAGNTPAGVAVVVTGAFEPPSDGRGMIQLLAFDARDGTTRAKVELHLDEAHAGHTILAAFDDLWSQVGGDVGMVRDIEDLRWDALESVLRAERCALHDPVRGGPHDRLAAMMHLGRAVEDAPDARFPAGRLAALALEAAMSPAPDAKLADAALRALVRAAEDAPERFELIEATAALHIRRGDPMDAESCARSVIARMPKRPRAYAILSEALRAQGHLTQALEAVDAGLGHGHDDLLLNERGVVLAEGGDLITAEGAWRQVIRRDPANPAAFANLAQITMKRGDTLGAQSLVDGALAAPSPHPDVLRRAIHLALATEAEGVARASRIARLAAMLFERVPNDAWALLMLSRANLQLGEKEAAKDGLIRVEALAPGTMFAAEAQRGRFSLADPQAALEIDCVLRAAYNAATSDLETISTRARRLARAHAVWTSWFAAGIAERRRNRWGPAREAFVATLESAPGCTAAHMELVAVCLSLKDDEGALKHAEKACALEGPNPRTLSVLATALLANARRQDADRAITQALTLDPTDAANMALAERIRTKPPSRSGAFGKLIDALHRLTRRSP
jgi:tetratricopeptide (TPR) repeat protein